MSPMKTPDRPRDVAAIHMFSTAAPMLSNSIENPVNEAARACGVQLSMACRLRLKGQAFSTMIATVAA